jgi:hypothetical protein
MTHDNNTLIGGIAASPAFFFAVYEQTPLAVVASFVLPVVFFFLGKSIDVAVRLYLERRKKGD